MDWTDEAIVLSVRKHGENGAVAHLLTRERGRHGGLVRGGNSKRLRGVLQSGNAVQATWRARLEEHLGTFSLELLEGHAARVMDDAGRLAAMASACALVDASLPEREPHGDLYLGLRGLLAALPAEGWGAAYVAWELALLASLGFGLDLSRCAATGRRDDLVYVSPRTGRAVSGEAGAAWRDKLLPLPGFLTGQGPAEAAALSAGLRLTGHFLDRHVLAPHGRSLPDARERLGDRWRRGLL